LGNTSVPLAPTIRRSAPLRLAAIENADTTAGHLNVKLVMRHITASVDCLNDHHLAIIELQCITLTARLSFSGALKSNSSKSIRQTVIECFKRLLIVAAESCASIAAALGIHIRLRVTPFFWQVAAGRLTDAFPFQEQLDLQQSQYLVVIPPIVPVKALTTPQTAPVLDVA